MGRRLRSLLSSEILKEVFNTLVIAALLRVTFLFVFRISYHDTVKELLVDLLILIGSISLTFGRKLFAIRNLIGTLLAIYDHTDRGTRRLWIQLLRRQIAGNLQDTFLAASSTSGAILSTLDVDLISQLCFRSGYGVYNGTDSNPPSEFNKKYPQYLAYHEQNIRKKDRPGIRVLVVSEEKLEEDFQRDRIDFDVFRTWHDDNSIELLQVDPETARKLANSRGLPSTDIGIWDKDLVAIFCQIDSTSDKLNLFICPQGSERFIQCQDYFLALLDNSNSIQVFQNRIVVQARSFNDRQQDKKKVREQWQE